jgi:hypothetical protein
VAKAVDAGVLPSSVSTATLGLQGVAVGFFDLNTSCLTLADSQRRCLLLDSLVKGAGCLETEKITTVGSDLSEGFVALIREKYVAEDRFRLWKACGECEQEVR